MTDHLKDYVLPILQRCGKPEEKFRMLYDEMRQDFLHYGVRTPWCLQNFPRFFCFLEYDMQTPAQFIEFMQCEFPFDGSEDAHLNFLMMMDKLLLYVQGWRYMKREEVLHISRSIEKLRTALID
jgi:hypothetical protein